MKKRILAAALFTAAALMVTGCGKAEKIPKTDADSGKKSNTASISTVAPAATTAETVMDSEKISNIPENTETEAPKTDDIVAEDFTYEEDENGEIVITGYKGAGGEVTIPAEIEGKAVVKIGEAAFDGRTDITAVTIPEGIKEIDNVAFRKCGITELTIPSSVKRIGGMSFRECESLETVIISEGAESMESAFYNCAKLSRVELPQSLTSIGSMAFLTCDSLKEVTISDNTEFLGERAFENCTVNFKGESYFMKVYDQTLYALINGKGYEVPNGVPPSA